MSHTPGPWICHLGRPDSEAEGCRCRNVLAEPYMGAIATVLVDNGLKVSEGGNDCPPEMEARANARLISAAPDLLKALEALAGVCRCTNGCAPDDMTCCTNMAAAAIRKARGT